MKTKKLWVVLCLSMMSISIALMAPLTAFAYNKSFSDVHKDDSHYKPIMELGDKGIVDGYADGRYGVNDTITRQQVAVIFKEAMDLELPVNIGNILKVYEDVDGDSLYAEQIAAVTLAGAFIGNNGKFNPGNNMTREQMASTIVSAFKLENKGTDPGIELSNVSPSHQKNVKILAQYGLTNQLEEFNPKGTVKRGQFATFLYHAMVETGMIDEIEEPEAPEKPKPDPEPDPEPPEEDKPSDPPVVQPGAEHYINAYPFDYKRLTDRQYGQKVDGKGAFGASQQSIEYFSNPSNFPRERAEYYQFLLLSYSQGLSAAEINKTILTGKGILEGQGEAFIEAGKKHNLNVLYLIAHALHETANGRSTLAKGYTVSKVDGKTVPPKKTYNMFGYGAYDSCPVRCGSETAYKQKWFTPGEAIIGGAQFIGNNYINNGQDTLYKMRWDTKIDRGWLKQYATHVEWATIQARKIHSMYDALQLHDAKGVKFEVPKFANQPGATKKPVGEAKYSVDTSRKGTVYITTANLNIRSYPWGGVLTTLPVNTIVTVVGENGGWYKVTGNGITGWVSGSYLTTPYKLKVVLPDYLKSTYIRPKPDNQSGHIATAHQNSVVYGKVDSEGKYITKNGYYKVSYQGKEGWIFNEHVLEQ